MTKRLTRNAVISYAVRLRPAITATAADVVVADTAEPNADGPGKKAGYQLSQHILDYYKTCVR